MDGRIRILPEGTRVWHVGIRLFYEETAYAVSTATIDSEKWEDNTDTNWSLPSLSETGLDHRCSVWQCRREHNLLTIEKMNSLNWGGVIMELK